MMTIAGSASEPSPVVVRLEGRPNKDKRRHHKHRQQQQQQQQQMSYNKLVQLETRAREQQQQQQQQQQQLDNVTRTSGLLETMVVVSPLRETDWEQQTTAIGSAATRDTIYARTINSIPETRHTSDFSNLAQAAAASGLLQLAPTSRLQSDKPKVSSNSSSSSDLQPAKASSCMSRQRMQPLPVQHVIKLINWSSSSSSSSHLESAHNDQYLLPSTASTFNNRTDCSSSSSNYAPRLTTTAAAANNSMWSAAPTKLKCQSFASNNCCTTITHSARQFCALVTLTCTLLLLLGGGGGGGGKGGGGGVFQATGNSLLLCQAYQLTNNLIANNLPPKFVQAPLISSAQPQLFGSSGGGSGGSGGTASSLSQGVGTNSEIVVRVKEGPQSIGKLIYTLKGEDPDDDPLTFGVLGTMASDLLRIENVPGNQANVYLKKELDRETTESHQVVITLTDGKLGKGNWVSDKV